MLNQVILVGRIQEMIMTELNGNKKCNIKLIVSRAYKNKNGEYDKDLIDNIYCIGSVADSVMKYCEKSSIVGIKGRLENEDGKIVIIAEKVTFLSNKPREEE